MAAPTQEFPAWLTQSITTLTDAAGIPVATSTTVLYLPLTYYGPSIPLNADWTYGGLSSPAPTISSPSLTTSSTATPTSSSEISSLSSETTTSLSSQTTPPPTQSSSQLPSQTSQLSSQTTLSSTTPVDSETATPSSSATPIPIPSGATSRKNANLAIILSSIFGALLIIFLLLLLFLCLKRRRQRATKNAHFKLVDPQNDLSRHWNHFGPGAENDSRTSAISYPAGISRVPGEGSPRGNGGEADSLLQQSSRQRQMTEVGGRPISGAVVTTQSSGSTLMSSVDSNASGFGHVIPPTLRGPPITEDERGYAAVAAAVNLPASQDENGQGKRWQILPVRDLNRIGEESPDDTRVFLPFTGRADVTPSPPLDDEHADEVDNLLLRPDSRDHTEPNAYSPLVPPHRLDPDLGYSRTPSPGPSQHKSEMRKSNTSSQRSSFPVDGDEAATLLTATRVQVGDLGPRPPPSGHSPTVSESPTTWLANLNWFKAHATSQSVTNNSSRSSSIDQVLDADAEQGQILRAGALNTAADRPISTISTGSGGSVYHDATSTLQSSARGGSAAAAPARSPSPLAPPPRVFNSQDRSSPIASTSRVRTPPAQTQKYSKNPFDDLLDEPAPRAFTALAAANPPFKTPAAGEHIYSDMSGSLPNSRRGSGSFAGPRPLPALGKSNTNPFLASFESSGAVNPQITIDLLEEAPPSAGAGWKSIAGAGTFSGIGSGSGPDSRYSFGMPSFAGLPVGHESLTSMRSGHLSPSGSRSGGSSSGSHGRGRGHVVHGSNGSSRISSEGGHSSNTGSSLSHSRSIHNNPPISPALSAFGPGSSFIRALPSLPGSPIGSATGTYSDYSNSPTHSPPRHLSSYPHPSQMHSQQHQYYQSPLAAPPSGSSLATTVTTTHTLETTLVSLDAVPHSPKSSVMAFTSVPWAAGLDGGWVPA